MGVMLSKVENITDQWTTRHHDRKRVRESLSIAREIHNQRHPLQVAQRTSTTGTSLPRLLALVTILSLNTTSGNGRPHDNIVRFDTDSSTIGVDNRASACISCDTRDFVGALTPVNVQVQGFGGHRTKNVMRGTIQWKWDDDNGISHTFLIPGSYYVPEGKVRLLSPQHWAATQKDHEDGTGETTTKGKIKLFWNNRKDSLHIPIRKRDNVANIHMSPGYNSFSAYCAKAEVDYEKEQLSPLTCHEVGIVSDDEDEPMVREERDTSITTKIVKKFTGMKRKYLDDGITLYKDGVPITSMANPREIEFELNGKGQTKLPEFVEDEELRQKTTATAELLRIHHMFGHTPFTKLQIMARQGILPPQLANCQIPVCSACLYGKAMRRSKASTKTSKRGPNQASSPGDIVSVDQLVSPTPGLVAQIAGKLTTKRYKYATVFVDNYSRFSYVHMQKTASAEETIEAKKAFQLVARGHGIEEVKRYHADNGVFRANKWVKACKDENQALTFAAVGAHHLNGYAEAKIRRLQEMARTMMIHAAKRWPTAVTTNLWPYAIRMANDATNETPSMQDPKRRTPQQIFGKTETNTQPRHWKPFGCPAYVLTTELQKAGGIHHKWKDRSKVGIYLGRSPHHGRNVALVLDRITGLVSPQFHVVFDPGYQTVQQDQFDSHWQVKAGFQRSKGEVAKATRSEAPKERRQYRNRHNVQVRAQNDSTVGKLQRTPVRAQSPEAIPEAADGTLPDIEREPGKRKIKPIERLINVMIAEIISATNDDIAGELLCYNAMAPYAGEREVNPLLAYKATADPDTMYMHEAMKEPDKREFKIAMQKEWDDQLQNGNFTLIHKSKVPEGATVLPAVWQMKRKRDIRTRVIKKYKARLNIDGSRMKYGTHYEQTYAPVASWNSIRTLLTMTALHGWHTTQIDYVLAFPQAPVEREIYMNIPKGFKINDGHTKDYVLVLHRNVYGQKQAGKVWYKYLTDILVNKVGFIKSEVDECVFYKGKVMYVLYTDDSILAGPDKNEIEQVIEEIKAAKLNITIEGTLEDFLGVNITRKDDGTIHLTQPHLIDQIVDDLNMNQPNVKVKSIPAASSRLLSRHSDSPAFDESFHYRSIVGKLNYLEKATRSDIAYITHQCARFVEEPKKEHGDAIRWLARYLKGTRTQGTILNPVKGKQLEVYVDADFAGNWDQNEWKDPDTARSRHGYIIKYAGCPLLWKSQLQTEHALSSTESEYTGLSYALRDAIPIMELLKEMMRHGFPIESSQAKVYCEVFEDNSGALEIAKNPKFRPRTKHLNNKLHHFRYYVDVLKEITIHKISTEEQQGDYLTKPLNETLHTRHRKSVMGW